MAGWSDGQKTGWPEVRMARRPCGRRPCGRRPYGQKSRWHIKQILKKWCSQCYTGYTPNVLPDDNLCCYLNLLLSREICLDNFATCLFWFALTLTYKNNESIEIRDILNDNLLLFESSLEICLINFCCVVCPINQYWNLNPNVKTLQNIVQ